MATEQALGSSSAPVRKQQQRSVVTQQKLLDAATEAFSESGFKGTSTRDIADRAGVHHPLITYHFKNKDQLWRAVADRGFQAFNAALLQAMDEAPQTNPKARAEALVRTYVQYSYQHPALHKIILQESSHPSNRLDWLVKTHLRPMFDEITKYLKELQEIGVAPAGNPALLFNMIRVSAGGLLALSLEIKGTSDIDFDEEGELNNLTDMILRCFLPGEPQTRHARVSAG